MAHPSKRLHKPLDNILEYIEQKSGLDSTRRMACSIILRAIILLALSWLVFPFSSESPSSSPSSSPPQPLRTFRAAVFQCECSLPNALFGLKRATDALRRAARHNVELLVFPELFLPGQDLSFSAENEGALDREAYELNILGQLSNQFGVACVVPYVEKPHESETIASELAAFSSAAIFHADGSRAGNYRRTKLASDAARGRTNYLEGNPIVEAFPISITLKSTTVQCGVVMGEELNSSPEQIRHLVRSGAEMVLCAETATSSAGGAFVTSERAARHIIPARAIENCIHVLCANYEGSLEGKQSTHDISAFAGLSAIVSPSGEELIRAPPSAMIRNGSEMESSDEGEDAGRVVYGVEGSSIIPCEDGTLYVAPITLDRKDCAMREKCADEFNARWDLLPTFKETASMEKAARREKTTDKETGRKGFGEANPKARNNNRTKKRKYFDLE